MAFSVLIFETRVLRYYRTTKRGSFVVCKIPAPVHNGQSAPKYPGISLSNADFQIVQPWGNEMKSATNGRCSYLFECVDYCY